jgi:organic radical activating enzyme
LDKFIQKSGDEIKLVYPLTHITPQDVESLKFSHFYLQPLDEENKQAANMQATIDYCLQNPKWHLSLQRHKILHIR